jgi:tRNA dimethylallyltransferase
VIAGPTGAGKTALAIEVARYFSAEIISADARQFYRELEIGTAKPDAKQLSAVKHHMINNKSIGELYGAGDFAADTEDLLTQLFSRYNLVVMVGGSGLYIDAVLNGVDEFESVDEEVRQNVIEEYNTKGLEWLREEVKNKDPHYFSSVDTNNPQRLMRALEVMRHSGRTFSSFHKKQTKPRDFEAIKILVNPERQELYDRINRRTDEMMSAGWLEEAKALYTKRHLNALKTVGYNELFQYIEGRCTLNEAVEKIKQHTRNYAKRQLTWFRNRDTFVPFDPSDSEAVIAYIKSQTGG